MSLDIPKIVLDPDNDTEMRAQAFQRIRIASKDTLTDFSPGSPIAALVEGQVYAQAELSYYLNMLPEALALEVFRLSDVERSPGTAAVGELTFLLANPISSDFSLPTGYQISKGDLSYELIAPLYIAAGGITAIAPVRATATGSRHNLPAYGISQGLGVTYLRSVYNAEAIGGGTDLEPLTDYVKRASRATRYRGILVGKSDYEREALRLLPPGYSAVAVPFLTSDRINTDEGNVHIFLLNADDEPVSTALAGSIYSQLSDQVPAGFRLWVSSADVLPLDLAVVLKVPEATQALADSIYASLKAWVSSGGAGLGKDITIDDLRYHCRTVPGVERTLTILIGPDSVDKAMPTAYTQATIGSLTLDLTEGAKNRIFVYGDSGDLVGRE